MEKYNPKIDIVFKKIFGTEENKDLLISLINSVLPEQEQVVDVTIKKTYNEIDLFDDFFPIVDTKAKDDNGRLFNIGIKINEQLLYRQKTFFYWSKLFCSQLLSGENFENLNKTIMINLLDFNYFDDDKYVRRCNVKDFDTNEIYPHLDYVDFYFIEMRKFDNELKHIKNMLDCWLIFLNEDLNKNNLPKEIARPEIAKAIDTLERMYFNEKESYYYEGRVKLLRDEFNIRRTAERKAEKKIAEKLKNNGVSVDLIAKSTGLTIEEIDKL